MAANKKVNKGIRTTAKGWVLVRLKECKPKAKTGVGRTGICSRRWVLGKTLADPVKAKKYIV